MEGIRDYLPEQNLEPLSSAILKVQEEHSSVPGLCDTLTLALYKFQVLRILIPSLPRTHVSLFALLFRMP